MAISSVGSSSYLSSIGAEKISSTLNRATETLSREVDSAKVRLSAFGQVKSAVAEVQSAARGLQDTKKIASADDAKKAAQAFVDAYNNERAALAKVTDSGSRSQAAGALATDGRAQVAGSQLQRVVSDNAASLKAAGITVQKDGSLAVDANAVANAFRQDPQATVQALGKVGRAVEVTATRQLSSTGTVGAAVESLNNRVQSLETRQADFQTRVAQSQQAVDSVTRRYGFGMSGAGAYVGIFGL